MSHLQDNKMSVKTNNMQLMIMLIYENYAYDDYQTLDPPNQFDDTFYTLNEYWDDEDDHEATI